jgi:hypothetical protein
MSNPEASVAVGEVEPEVTAQLTSEELVVITRFIHLLPDVGVQAVIVLSSLEEFGGSEKAAQAVGQAMQDLLTTCKFDGDKLTCSPELVVNAAYSLSTVAAFCDFDGFDERFVPNGELQKKCLALFHEARL